MDFLTILTAVAAIISIVSGVWIIVFGSKTIRDVVTGMRKGIKLSANLKLAKDFLLITVILILSVALLVVLLPPRTPQASVAVTSSRPATQPPVTTVTLGNLVDTPQPNHPPITLTLPKPPITIPCVTSCAAKLDVVIEGGISENGHTDTVLSFGLTNKGQAVCNLNIEELAMLDPNGIPYEGKGQIRRIGALYPQQQPLNVTATFSFVPEVGASYSLVTMISCQPAVPMPYLTEDLSFSAPIAIVPPKARPPHGIGLSGSLLQTIAGILTAMLVSFVGFAWLAQASPYGSLRIGDDFYFTPNRRTFLRKLFSKSVISSEELAPLIDLEGAKFFLVFKRNRELFIVAKSSYPLIQIHRKLAGKGISIDVRPDEERIPLSEGDIITINGRNKATFIGDEERE